MSSPTESDYEYFTPESVLNPLDSEMLERDITILECKEALDDLPSGKTPGTDGLTPEFYKCFWPELSAMFYNSIQKSILEGELTVEQRRGVISLIPKEGKNLKCIKNWRPISVLNVDYKVFAKILANRLKPIMSTIINEDQTGYVLNRHIGENIRIVNDLIYCTNLGLVEGAMMLIDFEKAFDSLNWDFLYYTLRVLGFGPNFQKLVKILYTNISSAILNNGFTTEYLSLKRGIRQGCPASAFLFILCAELFASKILRSRDVKGISIGNFEYKIMQFADDTILFSRDATSIKTGLDILRKYGYCSGLNINKDKTVLVNLNSKTATLQSLYGLKWCDDCFKYLGIWFLLDPEIM